jgi:methylenetetrahydrofolate dehydrogenase (NADP+)/methenyltetrahydrofolate cyclohydrolase/formyltetrahydrofolate synthetase
MNQVAAQIGLEDSIIPWGVFKAKVSLSILSKPVNESANYVVVTGISPTPLGEVRLSEL